MSRRQRQRRRRRPRNERSVIEQLGWTGRSRDVRLRVPGPPQFLELPTQGSWLYAERVKLL